MKKNLLSVVVPAYNVENYIEKCILSIERQTYQNIEIIIIDDGSTDQTSKIIDKMASEDKRIKVIHKENAGIVKARIDGVKETLGEYVTFVDSDDWIESDMYESLLSMLVDAKGDLITSGLLYDLNGIKYMEEIDLISKGVYSADSIAETIIPRMMYDFEQGKRAISSSVVNKIFNKNKLLNSIMEMDTNISYGEDAAITYPFIADCNCIVISNYAWYHYCIRENSMTKTFKDNAMSSIKAFYNYVRMSFEKRNLWDSVQQQVEEYTHLFVLAFENNYFNFKRDDMRYVFPYECIEKGTKIVLYGAGNVGKSYYKSIKQGGYATIVLWVDKDYKRLSKAGLNVLSPEAIKSYEYDYIVLAIDDVVTAKEIKRDILSCGVEKNKIIWKRNRWR